MRNGGETFLAMTHPLAALVMVAEARNGNDLNNTGWPLVISMGIVGLVFYVLLYNAIAKGQAGKSVYSGLTED